MDGLNEAMDAMVKDMEAKARKKIEEGTDEGHNALLADLKDVLEQAQELQFHDFLNTKYASPKTELITKLRDIVSNAAQGKYDN